jgi:putative transposase
VIKLKLNKAYKFRIYPNKEQINLLEQTFGCCRFIWNNMLNDKIEYYKEHKQTLNNTPAQYKKDNEFLKQIDSLALANVQLNLQTAFQNFFRDKKVGFPKFKSRKKTKKTYTTNNQKNSIEIKGNYIKLPKLKLVKLKKHRHINCDETIKSCTISKSPTGKYYVSVLVEYYKEIQQQEVTNESEVIGLDFSMHDFYYSSEDKKANYPKYYRKYQDELAKQQKRLSRKKQGSNNYCKQKYKIAKVHEKIKNCRQDWLHKLSHELSNQYNAVIIEDLNMKSMSQCLNFGKSVHDNGWGMFIVFLGYKLHLLGKQLIKIDKWYPSSKTCSRCENIKDDLQLSDRIYECSNCGIVIDRDYNASINIKRVGMTQLAW